MLATPMARAQAPQDPEIQVGVVQRFGSDPADTLTLEPLAGDRLTLKFVTGSQPQTLTTSRVTLEVSPQALPAPELQEWVVLSTHRSFESAEDSAAQWQARGIETDIAQPGNWQVWAQREVYGTPLLRRLLVRNLHSQGHPEVYLDSHVVQQVPRAAFVANGYRYNRDQVEITSANRRIRVTASDDPSRPRLYGGDLRLQLNAYGTYTLVNDVPIETYLRGVVPHEIGLAAPRGAMEAQAILARTYALRNLRRFEIDNYQLCADTQCQVYWGVGGAAPETDRAIANTRGQVLTYNNELVDALYSSTTGGVTAAFSHVWNGPDRPYLRSVIDSVNPIWDLTQKSLDQEANVRAFINLQQGFNEDEWDTFRWQRESSLTEITTDLKTYLQRQQHPLASFTKVLGLAVQERATSGRVQVLTVQTDRGEITLHKDEILRALSGPDSLLFYMDPVYEPPATPPTPLSPTASPTPPPAPVLKGYRFTGGGLGHGVGLSQTGAYRLGALGWSSARILSFYYPGTSLQPISDNLVFYQE